MKKEILSERFKLINMTYTHEAYVPNSERLKLKDYDIHTLFLSNKIEELNISDKEQLEFYKLENAFRSAILHHNYVKSNINRINLFYSHIANDKSVLGKRAVFIEKHLKEMIKWYTN